MPTGAVDTLIPQIFSRHNRMARERSQHSDKDVATSIQVRMEAPYKHGFLHLYIAGGVRRIASDSPNGNTHANTMDTPGAMSAIR